MPHNPGGSQGACQKARARKNGARDVSNRQPGKLWGRHAAGHGQYRRGGQLDRVVGAREAGRVDAQVDLEGAVCPFQGDIVAGQFKWIVARDLDAERVLAEPSQAAVSMAIGRSRLHW